MTESYISAFDLDWTLFRGNCSFQFCLHLISRKKLPKTALLYSIWCYILQRLNLLTLMDLHHKIFQKFLNGKSLLDLAEEVKLFISKLSQKNFYRPALEALRRAQKEGHETVLLSASPEFLVRPLGEKLGFEDIYASIYSADGEHNLCKISSVILGEDKARVLRQLASERGVPLENTIAYSDSILDLPFLMTAGIAKVVNPDGRLKKEAKKQGWQQI